jgi:hypothetical protein
MEWENTKLAQGDSAQEIARLKEQSGKDMVVKVILIAAKIITPSERNIYGVS